jgi:mRNA degradation ribonuclease J1/J2
MVERVNPNKVFPVHTENPAYFKKTKKKTIIIKKGKSYEL